MEGEETLAKFRIEGMAPLLQVYDMPISIHFYRDVLGFKVVMSSGEGDDVDWILMRLGDIELMLNTAYEREFRPLHPEAERISVHRDTTLYFGCPDTDELYNHMINNELNVNKPEITRYNWKALTFEDPDGYLLCFHWPLPNS
ncbi:VOC family protein [Mucilaginibacter sp. BJC16-A38]|uniref:VOC family protein n=1 Tax=Mucilaginibacter phenanthrenivorans TaxID=1234842 RepID=UPI0021582926|nr:VOC family protein [Mucilaginibacter phenanthrenivorans]MCR8556691.1 VOC family protein [Mucilaginibacter phenanthrenivorans]